MGVPNLRFMNNLKKKIHWECLGMQVSEPS